MYTRFLNPMTDFGFKKLFGEEESKPILKHFLYDLLELPAPIVELTFLPTLAIGGVQNHRRESPLRLDVTQHQMHAVILARRYVYK